MVEGQDGGQAVRPEQRLQPRGLPGPVGARQGTQEARLQPRDVPGEDRHTRFVEEAEGLGHRGGMEQDERERVEQVGAARLQGPAIRPPVAVEVRGWPGEVRGFLHRQPGAAGGQAGSEVRVGPEEALTLGAEQALVAAAGQGREPLEGQGRRPHALDAIHHQGHAPVTAGPAEADQVQLQAVLEAHPGAGQHPGPGPQGRQEPGLRIVPGRGGPAGPGVLAGPVPVPERHLAEGHTPGAQGEPGPGVGGERPQGRHHLVPGGPSQALGHGLEPRGGAGREAHILLPGTDEAGRLGPGGGGQALEVLLPAHLPGLQLLVHQRAHRAHPRPGHRALRAVHDPEVVLVQVEEGRIERGGDHPLPEANRALRPTG